jgi:hypothetical protein
MIVAGINGTLELLEVFPKTRIGALVVDDACGQAENCEEGNVLRMCYLCLAHMHVLKADRV